MIGHTTVVTPPSPLAPGSPHRPLSFAIKIGERGKRLHPFARISTRLQILDDVPSKCIHNIYSWGDFTGRLLY